MSLVITSISVYFLFCIFDSSSNGFCKFNSILLLCCFLIPLAFEFFGLLYPSFYSFNDYAFSYLYSDISEKMHFVDNIKILNSKFTEIQKYMYV